MAKSSTRVKTTKARPKAAARNGAARALCTDFPALRQALETALQVEAQAVLDWSAASAALEAARVAYGDARYAHVQAHQASMQATADLLFAISPST